MLVEQMLRWFCPNIKGYELRVCCVLWSSSVARCNVFDPFAGGSVRGIVTAAQGHYYWGADIRHEQVPPDPLRLINWHFVVRLFLLCTTLVTGISAQVVCNEKQWAEFMLSYSKQVEWPAPR